MPATPIPAAPEMSLQVVPIPVADVDRAVEFYRDRVGFHLDHDVRPTATARVVQLTPPGSACSIVLSTGLGEISEERAGSVRGLHLVVADIDSARDALAARGLDISAVDRQHAPVLYAHFSDPDGNTWTLQQV